MGRHPYKILESTILNLGEGELIFIKLKKDVKQTVALNILNLSLPFVVN